MARQGAYRALDGAYETTRRLHEGALRDLLGLFFARAARAAALEAFRAAPTDPAADPATDPAGPREPRAAAATAGSRARAERAAGASLVFTGAVLAAPALVHLPPLLRRLRRLRDHWAAVEATASAAAATGTTEEASVLPPPPPPPLPPLPLFEDGAPAVRRSLVARVAQRWSRTPAFQVADGAALEELARADGASGAGGGGGGGGGAGGVAAAAGGGEDEVVVDEEVVAALLAPASGLALSPFRSPLAPLLGRVLRRGRPPAAALLPAGSPALRQALVAYALRWSASRFPAGGGSGDDGGGGGGGGGATEGGGVLDDAWGRDLHNLLMSVGLPGSGVVEVPRVDGTEFLC